MVEFTIANSDVQAFVPVSAIQSIYKNAEGKSFVVIPRTSTPCSVAKEGNSTYIAIHVSEEADILAARANRALA